jgi:superfamily I DNA/RNA helicase
MSEIIKVEEYNKYYAELDETQKAVVDCNDEKAVIQAPSGSGKTLTLTMAIANYRYNHLNDRICAITYTRAATAEMKSRLAALGVTDVEITTIHAWCRKILNNLSDKYHFSIDILDEPHIKNILQEVIHSYSMSHHRRYVNLDIVYSYCMNSKLMDVSESYRHMLNYLDSAYQQYKLENCLYDFTDYPRYLYNILVSYHESINDIDALFVDEFQDVDSTQLEIFKRVNASKKLYIGDPWQSIYVFRGADGEVFNKLDDFKKYTITYNYRSYQCIMDYATTVYPELKDCGFISAITYKNPSSVICKRGDGGSVTVVDNYGNAIKWSGKEQKKEESRDLTAVKTWLADFMKKNPMILCRSNRQVSAVQENNYFDVSTIHQAKGLEYNNVLVIETEAKDVESCNVEYVAMTRAKDNLFVIDWNLFNYLYLQR